ncbi:hypothetical protein OZ411_33665 [Bradyrhizobium sp. Arg237L]|uniref:hypothetical protein n=1 Tax=Bradyrhizobium sp. Arg237L TaxID=3003352 RepID=UPI00249F2736|nr:hypothetical protein [Bradyrhizobium sp. Arg237L]MDI4237763.1 hypothetical protein [Bradyrhizobium sp. Arg237L]
MTKRAPKRTILGLRPPKPVTPNMQAKWSTAKERYSFYYNVRKKHVLAGCPVRSKSLGSDLQKAQHLVDAVLHPQFTVWSSGQIATAPLINEVGTFDWMKEEFFRSRFFLGEPDEKDAAPVDPKTGGRILLEKHKSRRWHINTMADFKFTNGRRVGSLPVNQITPQLREALLDALLYVRRVDPKTGEETLVPRRTTRNKVFTYVRAMWNHMSPLHPQYFTGPNPFQNMKLRNEYGELPAATRQELLRFVAAADLLGHPSIGTAALIAWEWTQREKHILVSLDAGDYRPANARNFAYIEHGKTDEFAWIALFDHEDGTPLFPEIMERLDRAKINRTSGPLIFRDHVWRATTKYEPWDTKFGGGTQFDRMVKKIVEAAGLRKEITFTSFRHGGLTELGEAELTELEIIHLSRHKSARVLRRYVKRSAKLLSNAQRKRLQYRKTGSGHEDAILSKTLTRGDRKAPR